MQVPFAISHPSGDVTKLAIWPGEAVPEGYFQPGALQRARAACLRWLASHLMIRTEAVTEIPLRFCSFHSRFVSRQPPPPNGQTLSRCGGSWPATASGAGTHRDSIPTLARPALAGDTHWYVAGWEDVGDGRGVSIRC
jgi:hypothetical protein